MQTLRLFCDVVTHRSFSKAAAIHGITQSAASQRIRSLEARLGITLIDRSVRPPAVTPPGELLHRHGLDLIERYDELEQRVREFRAEPAGMVRVDAIYSAGVELLNQIKTDFQKLHAKIVVTVNYKHPDEVFEAVECRQCDLGVVSYPHRYRSVDCLPLRDEVMAVVCAAGHPLADCESVHASELHRRNMVGFDPGLPVGRHMRNYFKQHNAHPQISVMFDNLDTIKAVVAVTNQLAILPARAVRRETESGSLVAIPLEPRLVRPMGIIFRRRRPPASAVTGEQAASTASDSQTVLEQSGLLPATQLFAKFLLQKAGPQAESGPIP